MCDVRRAPNSRQKTGENGKNERLRFLDHCQQVSISQQGLMVPLTGRNDK